MKNIKWYHVVIAFLIVCLFLSNCGKGGGFFVCNGNDTISHKIDTTIESIDTSMPSKPEPVKIIPGDISRKIPATGSNPKPIYITNWKHDTIPDYRYALPADPVDTLAILERYFETAIYREERKIPYGTATIDDTVSHNRIIGRGFNLKQDIPRIKETVTLRQPKRIVGYLDFNIRGNLQDPIHSVGAGLSLKGKNDMIYGAGVNLLDKSDSLGMFNKNKIIYEVRAGLPIRLLPRRK